jgi:spermidine synthase
MGDRRWPIIAIFVLSGVAGLVYEVVWARQLVLVFGNTTQAVSAILTGFFGGMAIGNAIGGRLADRVPRTLRLYGWMELLIVAVVLLTPFMFRWLHEVYRGAFASLEASPGLLVVVRFTLALIALGPATILMGATLPTLTRHLSASGSHLSAAFGRLYAANTAGAIVGAGVAGFVLIELLGLTGSIVAGAACSATAGISALWLDRSRGGAHPREPRATSSEPRPAAVGGPRPRLALAVAFVSGLTALGYQVLWTRLLATGTGNSTYVFTYILVVFLTGLALGAGAFNLLRRRLWDPVNVLALAQVVLAILAVFGVVAVIDRPANILSPYGAIDLLIGRLTPSVVLVVFPATFVMGLSLPVASSLLAGDADRAGEGTGSLLAVNTLGSIAATILVPFVVIPLIGSPHAVALLAMANAALGVALAFRGGVRERLARRMTGGMAVVALAAIVVMSSSPGVLVDPGVARVRGFQGTLFASAEDDIASVQAGEVDTIDQLWVTGTAMTALTVDTRLMPILSLALRPDSQTALVVAFGMGSAYRSALIAGLTTDAVELVPSVPTMFHWYFDDGDRVLADPRGHVIIADGRNHVELTQSRYDIIVVDPPPPIESSGVSVISSLEFYQAAQRRLNPNGVMMQWVPYGETVDEFRAHLRTYQSVFPHVLVARGPAVDGFYMFGSDGALSFNEADIRRVLERPGIVDDLSSPSDAPARTADGWLRKIPTLAWLSDERLAQFAGTGPLVTDDHPLPEYFLLRHLFGSPSPMMSPQVADEAAVAR